MHALESCMYIGYSLKYMFFPGDKAWFMEKQLKACVTDDIMHK